MAQEMRVPTATLGRHLIPRAQGVVETNSQKLSLLQSLVSPT